MSDFFSIFSDSSTILTFPVVVVVIQLHRYRFRLCLLWLAGIYKEEKSHADPGQSDLPGKIVVSRRKTKIEGPRGDNHTFGDIWPDPDGKVCLN
jgi:hypothetical protein